MKKILFILLIMVSILMLTSCKEDNKPQGEVVTFNEELTVVVPNGLPFMGVSNLLDYDKVTVNNVTGDQIPAALTKGEADIVIAPINAGAKLIKAGKANYKLYAPITFNNAYLVTSLSNSLTISKSSDLEHATITAFNEAGIPAAILKYLFTSNGFSTDNISFTYSSSAEVYGVYKDKIDTLNDSFILICEPELSKLEGSFAVYDLSKLFGRDIPQAAIFIKNDSNKEEVNKALELIEENVFYLNNNPYEFALSVVEKHQLFASWTKELIEKLIPTAGLKVELKKDDVNEVLTLLGVGALADDFYYSK